MSNEQECFKCGRTDDLERLGGIYICPDCASGDGPDEAPGEDAGCECDHTNPLCVCSTTDAERATAFYDFVDALDTAGVVDADSLRVMPLGEDKAPAIQGECSLESEQADLYLHDVDEAYTAIRHGHPGFAIYFGRPDHGTERLLAVDRDEPDEFPGGEMPETGVRVRSGSGTFPGHYYYENAGDVSNAAPDAGEVRAENYYCVTPGSIHPSDGIYYAEDAEGEVAEIEQEDLPEELHPASGSYDTEDAEPVELDTPEDLSSAAFENEWGMSLDEVREKSEKLDRLLTYLNPPGYPTDDTSRIDFHTASLLYWWRFDRHDIASIIQKYRNREKLRRRNDYLKRTVRNACIGDQMESADDDPEPVSMLPIETIGALDHDERRRFARNRGVEWPDVDSVRDRLYDTITHCMEEGEIAAIRSPTGSGKTYAVASEEWLWNHEATGDQPVIHAHKSIEARDQAVQDSHDTHGNYDVLRNRQETCGLAAGDYDPGNEKGNREITVDGKPVKDWIDTMCDVYGHPYSTVHGWLEDHIDGELPCEEDDTDCLSKQRFDGIPRGDDGEPSSHVVHCTHQFLHVSGLRLHTNVVLDERPDWQMGISKDIFRESINEYLKACAVPFDNLTQLAQAAESGTISTGQVMFTPNGEDLLGGEEHVSIDSDDIVAETARRASETAILNSLDYDKLANYVLGKDADTEDFGYNDYLDLIPDATDYQLAKCVDMDDLIAEELADTPSMEWFRDKGNVHAYTPAFARAIWSATEAADGRHSATVPYEPPRYDADAHDADGWNRELVTVVLDQDRELDRVRCKPDFSLARSVVGLDAHAQDNDPVWRVNSANSIETHRVLTPTEETLYRRYERGLYTVQIGDATMPMTSDKYLDGGQGQKIRAAVDHIRQEHGDGFQTGITSLAGEGHLIEAMQDAGIEEPETMHYGEEESRNDFAGENAGYVAGAIEQGDDRIMKTIAELDLDAEPATKDCPHCEGDAACDGDCDRHDCSTEDDICGLCNGSGEVREYGRTFSGPNAEEAEKVLQSVREHHVAQSAGRYARDAADPDDTAVVYIHTDAAPEGFIDVQAPGVTWTTTDNQREVLEYVRDAGSGVTAKEVTEATGIEKRTALRALKRATDEDILDAAPGAGAYGATVFEPREWLPTDGLADLGDDPDSTTTGDVSDSYTWSVVVRFDPDDAEAEDTSRGGDSGQQVSLAAAPRDVPDGG